MWFRYVTVVSVSRLQQVHWWCWDLYWVWPFYTRHWVEISLIYLLTYSLTYLLTVDAVCYSSPSKSSGSSMVLRTVLSLAILQQDTKLIASVLPSSTVLARDNSELAWLTAFCHLLQVLYLLAHSWNILAGPCQNSGVKSWKRETRI